MSSIPQNGTTAAEIISRVCISDVWQALGGDPPKHGRARAFWRNGDGLNVSLSDDKGCWHDFATDEGGGILDLVQRVQGGRRPDALKWLADFAGIYLQDSAWTDGERRDYGRRRALAEHEARELVWWRDGLLEVLRQQRDQYFHTYHAAKRFLLSHPVDESEGDWRWELAFDIQYEYYPKVEDFDARIDLLKNSSFAELLPHFRARQRRLAA
jgi:hypothetical protein